VPNAAEGFIGGKSKHQQEAAPALAPQPKAVLHCGQMLPPVALGAPGGVSVTRIAVLLHGLAQQHHLFAEVGAGRAHAQMRPQANALAQAQIAILGLGQLAACLLAVEHECHGF
jgi:hypothetical protein